MTNRILLAGYLFCTLSMAACSSAEKETTDKKESSKEVKDSSDTKGEVVEEQSEKFKLLTSMIGKHELSYIDGMVGMNSMFNFSSKDGVWKGEGSSNEGGERDGYDIEIGNMQLKKLKSLSIVVSEDLTVTLEGNGKTYCVIPYDENLKELKLDNSKEYMEYDVIPKDLSEEKSVFNSWHYLLVRDDLSKDLLYDINAAGAFDADYICIKVSENLKEFQMEMRAGACCDQATYVFKK